MRPTRHSFCFDTSRALVTLLAVLAAWAAAPTAAVPQTGGLEPDSVRAGQFDNGKMWTFEYAPAEYFSQTYGFDATPQWFERARMAALRIPGCSASFVSPTGLLATNHHCVRGAVSRVSRRGESLLDDGFYAASLDEERRIPGYYADQLIAAHDITNEVVAAAGAGDPESAQQNAIAQARTRLLQRYASQGDSIWVQIVPLYSGGRHSAYVFRRFTDVRLVQAVELQTGFFGGDPDNFTYPRYALDFAFLRVYGSDGQPLRANHYFGWSRQGVEQGDVVFVIGNPGQTNRLKTLAQLEYQRDVEVPPRVAYLTSRLDALRTFSAERPEEAEALGIRNRMFSLSNSLKAFTGRLAALRDPVIMARRRDAERSLLGSIESDATLRARYASVFGRIAELQGSKRDLAASDAAFVALGSPAFESALIRRAMAAYRYWHAPADSVDARRQELLAIGDNPAALERRLLSARLADFGRHFGAAHAVARSALPDGTPEASAASLLAHSALADSARTARAMAAGALGEQDPALRLAATMMPVYEEFRDADRRLDARERDLAAELGRARFAVYGQNVPPDGTFSPRITDGVVRGYEYNGTLAPPYTTFYGVYDRFYSQPHPSDWDLPARWRTPPAGLDLATPLNFVSTADTYGGNSGSPAVTRDLELVGLNFDRNIEGLSRDFVYLPDRGRNIMVDVRAIRAALEHVYGASRILQELEAAGSLTPSQ